MQLLVQPTAQDARSKVPLIRLVTDSVHATNPIAPGGEQQGETPRGRRPQDGQEDHREQPALRPRQPRSIQQPYWPKLPGPGRPLRRTSTTMTAWQLLLRPRFDRG